MAITEVGSAAVPTGNPTTSFTVTIQSGCQANDILILSCTNRDATTAPSVTDNDTGGNTWTRFDGGTAKLTCWWKRATSGTASKTVTCSGFTGSSSGVLRCFRGVSLGVTPYENVSREANIAGNEVHAGITPTRNGCWVFLCIANTANDNAVTSPSTTSPGALSGAEKLSTGGSDCANHMACAQQTTAGATGNFTWAQTDGTTDSCVFDLLPAADALTAAQGSFSLTGQAASLAKSSQLVAESGSFALTGFAATLSKVYVFPAAHGAFSLSGIAAGLVASRKLTADQGTVTLTGIAAQLLAQRLLSAALGSFSLTGQAATLTHQGGAGNTLTAETGAFNVSGIAASLLAQRKITAAQASFALTGPAPGLVASRRLAAAQGAFTLTGFAANLSKVVVLTATSGSFALSGFAAGLTTQRQLTAAQAAFVLVGSNAGLRAGRLLLAAHGAFVVTGFAAALSITKTMLAAHGAYVLTGQALDLRHAALLVVAPGVFVLAGQAAELTYNATPPILDPTAGPIPGLPIHGYTVAVSSSAFASSAGASTFTPPAKSGSEIN